MLTLAVIFGVAVGLALGLTGGGGSIIAVPLLVYGLSMMPRQAVGVSLAAVGSTALVGAAQRLSRHEVEVRTGLMFEPRGHDLMSGSILYPSTRDDCDIGVLFIETTGCLPMCGHGTIGTVTSLQREVRVDIDRDKILTADEAKEYGLIDDVLAYRKMDD